MKKLTTILFFILTIACQVSAQNYKVSGRVFDKTEHKPLPGANVILIHLPDSSNFQAIQTDTSGRFSLSNVKPDRYKLKCSFIGYNTTEQIINIEVADVARIRIGMEQSAHLLKNVVVEGITERAIQKGDTTEYNAKAYKVNPDAKAEDLLEKMPGITNNNGTVQAHGEDIKKVLVDGKEFFGDDASMALKNLPAEIIDKVQVYDKQGDQAMFTGFNDGNTEKTLNIITKKGVSRSTFGKAYAGYGTSNTYNAGGNVNIFNGPQRITVLGLVNNINQQNFSQQDLLGLSQGGGGRGSGGGGKGMGGPGGMRGPGGPGGGGSSGNYMIGQQNGINTTYSSGFNFQDTWFNRVKFTGSYFFNNSRNETSSDLKRTYFVADNSNLLYNETNQSESNNYNHRFSMRFDYTIDSLNSLLITPRLSLQDNRSDAITLGNNLSSENTLISQTNNNTIADNTGYNFSNDLLFRHKFHKKGRTISVNLGTGINDKSGTGELISENSFTGGSFPSRNLKQETNTLSASFSLSSNLTYTEPVGKNSQLAISYLPSYVQSNSDKKTLRPAYGSNDYTLLDTALSNDFNNLTFTQKAGISFNTAQKRYNFTTGLDGQNVGLNSDQSFPSELSVNKSFNNLLPRVNYQYKFSSRANMKLTYNTNTQTPSISQLQNVIDNSNPLALSAGNPELRQQYAHDLKARLSRTDSTKTKVFFGMIGLSYTRNYIGNSNTVAISDTLIDGHIFLNRGSKLSRPVNLGGYYNLRSFITYGLPVKFIKSNLNFNLGFTFNNSPGLINDAINYSQTYNMNSGFLLSSNISEKIDFKINYFANYNIVLNTIQSELNNNYYTGIAGAKLTILPWKGFVINTELNYNHYIGLTNAYNPNIFLLNAGIGYKFLKNKAGEIRLTAFDLLNKNNNISRNITETYIEDTQTRILKRYFMLNFTYTFRHFKKLGENKTNTE